MKCKKCSKELEENTKFCNSCGAKVGKDNKNSKKILIIVGIILFIFIIGFIVLASIIINKKNTEKIQTYENFEERIEGAAESYLLLKKYDSEEESEFNILLGELKKENLINDELLNKCDGYVLVHSKKDVDDEYEYDAYISCKDYKTKGYKEKYSKKQIINLNNTHNSSKIYLILRDVKGSKLLLSTYSENDILETDNKLGEYSCSTKNCYAVSMDYYGKKRVGDDIYGYAVIYDNEYVLYDYKNNIKYNTGMDLETINDDIKLVSIWGNIQKLYGIILNDKKYYSVEDKKVMVSIKNGKLDQYGLDEGYLTIINSDKSEELINIKTGEKSSAYLTNEAYDSSYYTKDKIIAKFSVDNISPNTNKGDTSGSIYVTLYKDGYMELSTGWGGVNWENSRGKYSVDNNKLVYKRMYKGYDESGWKKMVRFEHSAEAIFNINNNTLNVQNFEIINFYDEKNMFNATLNKTYSIPDFKF